MLRDGDEGVGVGGGGVEDLRKGACGVVERVGLGLCGWVEVLEEGEGGAVYDYLALLGPGGYGVVEELCCA